jgi:predicted SprT family Zn-dependent metalloprotease
MNKTLQYAVDSQTNMVWDTLCEMHTRLVRYNPPKIVLCNRLTRTAGKSYQEENRIHLAAKFFAKHDANMRLVILPHELAHQADFNLFGISEKNCGHGANWCMIMLQLGLAPNKYHSMTI